MPDRHARLTRIGDRLDVAAQWAAVGICVVLAIAGAWSAVAVFLALWGWA